MCKWALKVAPKPFEKRIKERGNNKKEKEKMKYSGCLNNKLIWIPESSE